MIEVTTRELLWYAIDDYARMWQGARFSDRVSARKGINALLDKLLQPADKELPGRGK